MLEVEPASQHRHVATRSGRYGNEAVDDSEAFVRWLHHHQGPDLQHLQGIYASVELPSAGLI